MQKNKQNSTVGQEPVKQHPSPLTNYYTLDQLDAGKSMQGRIQCVSVCYLDYLHFSQPVHVSFIHRIGCSNLMMGIGKISIMYQPKPVVVTLSWLNGI